MIFIYFFAPIISVSVLGTALTYIYKFSPAIFSRLKSGHVVICGTGRIGKLLVSTLLKQNVSVVGVDLDLTKDLDEFRAETKVPIINGDFLSNEVLEKAGALKASNIIFTTSDDLINIEGVIGTYGWLKKNRENGIEVKLWVHVANEKLAEIARQSLQSNGNIEIKFFDTFQIAARRTVRNFFNGDKRKGIKEIIILGFGKFGHDLMEALIRDANSSESWNIQVVDICDRAKDVKNLADDLGISDKVSFKQSDIYDLELVKNGTKAFFLCTDDDIRNLTTALMLTSKIKGSCIYVRMGMWPLAAVKDHLQDERGLMFINIDDLIVKGIKELNM